MTPSRNGCYNGPLGEARAAHTYSAQRGWVEQDLTDKDGKVFRSRVPVIVQIPHVMTTDCQYSISTKNDPKCAGCKWKKP